MHHGAKLELDPLRHTEPMDLVAHDSCQSVVVFLCARDNAGGSVKRSLHSSAIFCHVARLTDGVPVNLAVRCQVVSSLDQVTTGDTDPVDLVTDG